MNDITNSTGKIEPIALNQVEARAALGGPSRSTMWRLEKTGQLRPIAGVRRKLYAVQELRRFAAGAPAKRGAM